MIHVTLKTMSNFLYFLYGDEGFLVEEKRNELLQAIAHQERVQFSDRFEIAELHQALFGCSLFATQKVILIKNPWFLIKTAGDDDIPILEKMIQDMKTGPHTTIIYLLNEKADMRKKLAQHLKKNAQSFECQAFKDWEQQRVLDWLRLRLKKQNIQIDDDAILAMEQAGGINLRHMASEIEKLQLYIHPRTRITLEDVLTIVSGCNTGFYNFNEAFKRKQTDALINELTRLLENNEPPIKILSIITSSVRFYYQILTLLAQKKRYQEIAQSLGKNPYFVQKTAEEIKKHHSLKNLKNAFQVLSTTDLEIKSGRINPEVGLTLALLKICQ